METPIRMTSDRSQADEWALVLTAEGIAHRLERDETGWLILVPIADGQRAEVVLQAYDEETRGVVAAAMPEAASRFVSWTTGVMVGVILLGFFAITGPARDGSPWFERGAAFPSFLLHGEPWRAVTALTLHVDAVHVAGNAVATAALLTAVVQRLGPGCGVWLVLLAGASANVLGAALHGARYVSVGASTASFGALGLLAGLRLAPTPSVARWRTRPRTIVAAALLLLVMLGTSPGADVLAHLLGLVCGGVLGVLAGVALPRPLRTATQAALGLASAATVVGSWLLALA